jgi:hypothetical protein
MSRAWIPAGLRADVERRAHGRCEYCLVPDGATLWPHEADHVIAQQHGGKTDLGNLAFACFHCNRHKGPNVASVDGETGDVVPVFNPRIHRWREHFATDGARIVPLSPVGRVTAALFRFNSPERLTVRRALWEAGRWCSE